MFAAPKDSAFAWLFWPEQSGTNEDVWVYLKRMVENGKLKKQDPMKRGTFRHQGFVRICQEAGYLDEIDLSDQNWHDCILKGFAN